MCYTISVYLCKKGASHMLKKIAALLLCACAAGGVQCGRGCRDPAARAAALRRESAALQKALNNYLGGSATLKYPASGDFLSPFAFGDWDGDGTDEAAVLCTPPTRPAPTSGWPCSSRRGEQLARQPRGGGPDQRGAELFRRAPPRHVEPAAAGRVCLAPGRPISGCLSI